MPPGDGSSTRSLPRLLVLLAAGLLAVRIGAAVWERAHPARVVELVEWQPIAGSWERASAAGMPVLYDFTADWCAPCQKMQREVFADRHSAETINRLFVAVRVLDRSKEEGRNPPEVEALKRRYGVSAFPTLVMVVPGERPEVIEGYSGKSTLMQRLTRFGAAARLRPGVGAPPTSRPPSTR